MEGTPAAIVSPLRSFLFVISLALCGCSTLVGSVKPVDQKSNDYGVLDLAKASPDVWRRLDDSQLIPTDAQISSNTEAFSSEITDMAFQSKKTVEIISMNTSCREGREPISDLRPFLNELLLGISDVTERTEKPTQLSGTPALEGTVAGNMAGQATKIRAIVLSKAGCVYALMYISRPNRYSAHEADFTRFISSLRLR